MAVIFVNVSNETASDLCCAARNNSGPFVNIPPKKKKEHALTKIDFKALCMPVARCRAFLGMEEQNSAKDASVIDCDKASALRQEAGRCGQCPAFRFL